MCVLKHKARKSLGQHFILESSIAERIVSHAGDIEGRNIIEVGPGLGIMSEAILKSKAKSLVSIEKDRRLLRIHESLMAKYPNYRYVQCDVLDIDLNTLISAPSKMIANLPYNISVTLLLKMLQYIHHFEGLTLMFQKEVADRLVAKPSTKSYSSLSALVQLLCDVEKVEDLHPGMFSPSPKVHSSVVNITPLGTTRFPVDYSYATKVLRKIFNYKRKTMRNSLELSAQEFDELLEVCKVSPSIRAENLSIKQLCEVSNFLQSRQYQPA
ncbi:16S rRNA (adenine(1518)-N(6)/adenine(1519)-N(6))-dimethyltransferase RsmA [Anaplasma capra]|uniref:16S rRNA (adenine(1518)-N(6)/adenine(1519)-N(6))- dimethyltransferase RsmA n=1 Tax=Anaplasma capra TaxID=1562740 RepID=UPI0021D59D56|nr:16S rRNA (adenine(1518)-N(6)/adenine(1519)-N(6))-dimethyltransferase RsmA [Anaplasma capra]MCU7611679.1 16S rRNA (adenine(1518)-N(6)/adenine(1519)-N(6))-dimethyltransferase RsmA [Anaplasma capra]MCU7612171.1 16S rRNA (adenine(1518)-N(6)/adenine(1519)-N(6))-dimethyltransferase RsmA [Anaplasma capra]